MCIETIEVDDVGSAREAYEISEYLKGVPYIDDAQCDFLANTLTVDYDETLVSREEVLDEIEHAGCHPCERKRHGPIAVLRRTVGV